MADLVEIGENAVWFSLLVGSAHKVSPVTVFDQRRNAVFQELSISTNRRCLPHTHAYKSLQFLLITLQSGQLNNRFPDSQLW